jgi:hypothetical protein
MGLTMQRRRTVEDAERMWVDLGDRSGQVVACWVCGHSWYAHYSTDDDRSGCVADEPPKITLAGAIADDRAKPFLAQIGERCLCPGFEQGQLPHAITKHLDALTTDDEDLYCQVKTCRHGLHEHDEEYGCWRCPCDVRSIEQSLR